MRYLPLYLLGSEVVFMLSHLLDWMIVVTDKDGVFGRNFRYGLQ